MRDLKKILSVIILQAFVYTQSGYLAFAADNNFFQDKAVLKNEGLTSGVTSSGADFTESDALTEAGVPCHTLDNSGEIVKPSQANRSVDPEAAGVPLPVKTKGLLTPDHDFVLTLGSVKLEIPAGA
ncbi:MAG: hypothetical protein MJB14_10665, partial [Spirochaetes bacterium]|nr:hypothetical protein [Spirochaetota bacterium]